MGEVNNIRIAGFGGQGVMMFGQLLAFAATNENLYGLWYPSYGPETRGGTANCSVIVSHKPINSPVFQKATQLVVFNEPSLKKFIDKILPKGLLLYNSSLIAEKPILESVRIVGVPINELALTVGSSQVANMVMLGAYLALTDLFPEASILKALAQFLGEKKAHLLDINKNALAAGRDFIAGLKG
jgi:2-oxoglutarate ferredoxin oxidoreductase subunit gamma